MKISRKQMDRVELLFGDPDACLIGARIEFGLHAQPGRRRRVGNQLDNHCVTGQRLPPPVGRNLAEQAMLNLVPFTGARWKMAHPDDHSQFIGQLLQRHFPESAPTAIAATAISSDQQFLRLRIQGLPQLLPPPPNRRDRKFGGIVLDAHTHPAEVRREVINAVRNRLAQLLVGKVVAAHESGMALETPFPPIVFEISDQLFLLGVDRDDRLGTSLKGGHFCRNMLELCIAIWMLTALVRLAIGLQAVAQFMQQVRDFLPSDLKPLLLQFYRQSPDALAGPPQGRLRITARCGFYQRLQRSWQVRLPHHQWFASATRTSDPLGAPGGGVEAQLLQPDMNGSARYPRYPGHRRDATIAQRFGFHCCPQPSFPFIQNGNQIRKPLSNGRLYAFSLHRGGLLDQTQRCYCYLWTTPKSSEHDVTGAAEDGVPHRHQRRRCDRR